MLERAMRAACCLRLRRACWRYIPGDMLICHADAALISIATLLPFTRRCWRAYVYYARVVDIFTGGIIERYTPAGEHGVTSDNEQQHGAAAMRRLLILLFADTLLFFARSALF